MSLVQSRPGGGGQRKPTHFVHNKTPQGGKWEAWIAGPCHWFMCHTRGRSKPCAHVVTGGELKCELCSPENPVQLLGYQPLFKASDGRPCFAVVHECSFDQIEDLKFRQPVLVGRDTGATDTVWIMPSLSKRPWHSTTLAEFQQPANLTPSLIRIWKLPALTEWYQRRTEHKIHVPTVVPEKKPLKARPNGKPFSPVYQAAAARVGMPDVEAKVEAEYEKVIASITRKAGQFSSENGNGTKAH